METELPKKKSKASYILLLVSFIFLTIISSFGASTSDLDYFLGIIVGRLLIYVFIIAVLTFIIKRFFKPQKSNLFIFSVLFFAASLMELVVGAIGQIALKMYF